MILEKLRNFGSPRFSREAYQNFVARGTQRLQQFGPLSRMFEQRHEVQRGPIALSQLWSRQPIVAHVSVATLLFRPITASHDENYPVNMPALISSAVSRFSNVTESRHFRQVCHNIWYYTLFREREFVYKIFLL